MSRCCRSRRYFLLNSPLNSCRTSSAGPIPPELRNLSALQLFFLEGNQLSGESLGTLVPSHQVSGMSLAINPLASRLSRVLKVNPAENTACNLRLRHSNTGSIPPELGDLGALQLFKISWNQLSGESQRA